MLASVGETPEERTGGGEVPDQRRRGNSPCPTAPEITIPPHLFKTLLIERLQLPRHFCSVPGGQVPLDILGLHRGSYTRTGREQRRAAPTERMNVIVPARDSGTIKSLLKVCHAATGNGSQTPRANRVGQPSSNKRQNHSGSSVAFETTVFVVALGRFLCSHSADVTLTNTPGMGGTPLAKPSTSFAASQPRRGAEGPRKYGKSGRVRICGGPSKASLSDCRRNFRVLPLLDVQIEHCESFIARSQRRVADLDAQRAAWWPSCKAVQWRPGCKRNAG